MERKNADYRKRLERQLAVDYCCTEEEMKGCRNQFHIYRPLEGRRRFRTDEDCFLKVVSYRNRLLFAGHEEILDWCRERFAETVGAWFMEPETMRLLDRKLGEYGYEIGFMHPFYVSFEEAGFDEFTDQAVRAELKTGFDGKSIIQAGEYELRIWRAGEIEHFRGDARFSNAYSFCETAPDMIGISASLNGEIVAMAGVSADSPELWQIGIDVLPAFRGRGLGVLLVKLLKNETLRAGRIPFYGTAFSHMLSQDIAIRSGFRAGWAELTARKAEMK